MENQNLMLPVEVEQLAQNVTAEKRSEVQTVLNHVFNGVSKMREQLDSVVVVDPNDKTNMKLANTIRLCVRAVRLDAEKTFDAKRSEVQAQMLSYKTEDALWLKAKQTMQILTKEIEENARWKEETKERFEAEQKELKTQQRMLRISKVAPSVIRSEFENMTNDVFDVFVIALERDFNDKIAAEKQAETERMAKELADEKERQLIKLENEQLKAEAEAKKIQDEKRNKELAPFIVFIRDYNKMLNLPEVEYQKEFLDIHKGAELQWEFDRKEAIKKQKESEETKNKLRLANVEAEKAKAEKDKLEAKIKVEADAEEKARKDAEAKAVAEQKAKEDAEKKAANAPDKTKLIELALQIDALNLPEIKSEEAKKILVDVKTLLAKVSTFIRDKSTSI